MLVERKNLRKYLAAIIKLIFQKIPGEGKNMNIENFIKNLNVKKIMVWSGSLFFGLIILRELLAFIGFHLLFSIVSHQWENQQKEMRQFHQDVRKEMNQIENRMNNEMEAVQQGINEMQKKMTDFGSEFAGAEKVQEEMANAWPEFPGRSRKELR
ncbi:MAG: hypothetical protein K0R24_1776 [Gammaproteobacteria bacterium]|jgi:hypothetical protein|nr:hypothetical protein [Gammaproteobacteria bacterium]